MDSRLDFRGRAAELLGWIGLSIVGAALVVPLAWVSASVARWVCRNTVIPDGTKVEFRGTGGDVVVWHVFFVLASAGQYLAYYSVRSEGIAALVAVMLISIIVLLAIVHTLIKWFVFNAQLSTGPQLAFNGHYLGLLGWYLAFAVSIYTIVGWAWVAVAMYRWLLRHVRGRGVAFEFHAKGHEMLWRGLLTAFASVFVIPIPWVWIWFSRWLVQQVTLRRFEEGELTTPA